MALETGTFISDLVSTNPTSTDPKAEGDDHIRLLKSTIKATFPNVSGAVTPTHTELNYVDGVTSAIQTQLDSKAPLNSPALTGAPTAPTAAAGTNTTQVATTAYVMAERTNAATLTNKTLTAPVINSPTGLVKADVGLGNVDNTSDLNKPVSTDTQTALNLKADLVSPAFTGTPTAPTATAGTNTDQLATCAFVTNQALTATLPGQSGNAGRYLTTNGTSASWGDPLPSQTGNSGSYLTTNGSNASWATLPASGDASTNTSTSVDSEIAIFSGTGGKTLKRATGTGMLKMTSGVLQTAVSGTDFVTPNGVETLTNKTIAFDSNTLTGVQPTLVSGTNIKTVNSQSLLGSGDLSITGSEIIRVARTSNTILGTSNRGNLIDITSGTFTQTFTAAATLGSGWFVYIRNSGTGDITLDPNASETIDGLTSYIMYPGEVRLVQCDGSALRSVVLNAFYRVFTASGTFTKPPGYTHFGIDAIGAGGGGQSGAGGQANGSGGSGGGNGGNGGNCIRALIPQSLVTSSTTVTVGAGGTGGAQSSTVGVKNAGTAGGVTTFGSLVSSDSTDQGGYFSGASGGSGTSGTTGGTPGTPAAVNPAKAGAGGGGGGSGGSQSAATPNGATGGTSISAGTGGNGGKGGTGSAPQAGTAGENGVAPGGGGGGGGGGSDNLGIGGKGGDGARGELRIWGVI